MITVEINEDYLHEIINELGMVGLRMGFCREYFEGNKPIGEEAAMLKIVDDMSDNWKNVLSFLESLNGDRHELFLLS